MPLFVLPLRAVAGHPRRRGHVLIRIVLLLAALPLASVCLVAADDDGITAEEVKRGFRTRTLLAKPRTDLTAVERAEAAEGLLLLRAHTRFGGLRTLETDGAEDVNEVIARLKATGLYDYVEPDYIRRVHATPNDPRFGDDQWSLNNTGQSGGTRGADIKATAAWDIQREAPDVIVAVMDTGVRIIHEDIASNLWVNAAEQGARPAIDDDANGYIGSDDGFVHAVNPDGTLRRTYATGGPILAAPILSAGRLYVASTDAKLHAFEIGTNLARSPWPMHRHNLRRTGRVIDPLPGIPTISAQPVAATADVGVPVAFRVTASVPEGGALTYQWRFNDQSIPGRPPAPR